MKGKFGRKEIFQVQKTTINVPKIKAWQELEITRKQSKTKQKTLNNMLINLKVFTDVS